MKYVTESLEDILNRDFSYNAETGFLFRKGVKCGTKDKDGYLVVSVRRKNLKAHRICWFLQYGDWPKFVIDHINRIPSDNRLSNLRDVTQKVNISNSRTRSDNKSGVRGVSWDKSRQMWMARKTTLSGYKFIGYYRCITSASVALRQFCDKNNVLMDCNCDL